MPFATSYSFRRILLARILLLLMPFLGLSEWLVFQQASRSLLENAQAQASEIAKSRALTLALHQRDRLASEAASSHFCTENSAENGQACESVPINPSLDPSLESLLSQPFPPSANVPAPVIALLDEQGALLGHSDLGNLPCQPSSQAHSQPQSQANAQGCELIRQLTSPGFDPAKPPRSLGDRWIIASQSLNLPPLTEETRLSPRTTQSTEPAPLLIVALPTRSVLAPLEKLSRWIMGATLLLASFSVPIALLLSRELARPAERLRDRLIAVQQQLEAAEQLGSSSLAHPPTQLDPTFKIREFQQLAGAFNQLINCLNQRTTALEQATQEARNASQLKTDFLAATSHELRTPLNALIGHIHLIQDGFCDSPEEEATCLAQVNQAALHLLKVLNELLDVARIEAGNFEFQQQQFDLAPLLAEVLDLENSHLIQKELNLQIQPSIDSYWVEADRDKLKQVMLNVISNAIKFTDRGSITINLQRQSPPAASPAKAPPTADWVVLSVTDTGIGIDSHQQKRLFQPFVRASQRGKNLYEGSGLGLAISRTLMERMGGGIRLHSPGLGRGTTVEIQLPLDPDPPACQLTDPSGTETSAPSVESAERINEPGLSSQVPIE